MESADLFVCLILHTIYRLTVFLKIPAFDLTFGFACVCHGFIFLRVNDIKRFSKNLIALNEYINMHLNWRQFVINVWNQWKSTT